VIGVLRRAYAHRCVLQYCAAEGGGGNRTRSITGQLWQRLRSTLHVRGAGTTTVYGYRAGATIHAGHVEMEQKRVIMSTGISVCLTLLVCTVFLKYIDFI
jgi:hypothetical protein